MISTPYFLSHNNLKISLWSNDLPQVTDIMVAALNADCALLNSGTLRSDQLHKAGEFSLRVSNISSEVIFAANGDSNGFSGLAGHPSHDG